jgi:hypothetical protein
MRCAACVSHATWDTDCAQLRRHSYHCPQIIPARNRRRCAWSPQPPEQPDQPPRLTSGRAGGLRRVSRGRGPRLTGGASAGRSRSASRWPGCATPGAACPRSRPSSLFSLHSHVLAPDKGWGGGEELGRQPSRSTSTFSPPIKVGRRRGGGAAARRWGAGEEVGRRRGGAAVARNGGRRMRRWGENVNTGILDRRRRRST